MVTSSVVMAWLEVRAMPRLGLPPEVVEPLMKQDLETESQVQPGMSVISGVPPGPRPAPQVLWVSLSHSSMRVPVRMAAWVAEVRESRRSVFSSVEFLVQ